MTAICTTIQPAPDSITPEANEDTGQAEALGPSHRPPITLTQHDAAPFLFVKPAEIAQIVEANLAVRAAEQRGRFI
jgi:hypothetical protein